MVHFGQLSVLLSGRANQSLVIVSIIDGALFCNVKWILVLNWVLCLAFASHADWHNTGANSIPLSGAVLFAKGPFGSLNNPSNFSDSSRPQIGLHTWINYHLPELKSQALAYHYRNERTQYGISLQTYGIGAYNVFKLSVATGMRLSNLVSTGLCIHYQALNDEEKRHKRNIGVTASWAMKINNKTMFSSSISLTGSPWAMDPEPELRTALRYQTSPALLWISEFVADKQDTRDFINGVEINCKPIQIHVYNHLSLSGINAGFTLNINKRTSVCSTFALMRRTGFSQRLEINYRLP